MSGGENNQRLGRPGIGRGFFGLQCSFWNLETWEIGRLSRFGFWAFRHGEDQWSIWL